MSRFLVVLAASSALPLSAPNTPLLPATVEALRIEANRPPYTENAGITPASNTGSVASNTYVAPNKTIVGTAPSGAAADAPTAPVNPSGVGGRWNLVDRDEFDGAAIDWSRWQKTSWSQSDCQQGNQYNYNNGQAEWSQADDRDNAFVSGGVLTFRALRETVYRCGGKGYDWTSARLQTRAAYSPGSFVELRFKMGRSNATAGYAGGTWEGFWTWCADGSNGCEIDGYEAWPPQNSRLSLTSHLSGGGHADVVADPITGWHTMGIRFGTNGNQWYLDGRQVLANSKALPKPINVIIDHDVCNGKGCPIPSSTATRQDIQFDYFRVWKG